LIKKKQENLPEIFKPGNRIFQRNYYEHIVRDQDDLNRIRAYTRTNPQYWHRDPNNPTDLPTA